MFCSKCGAEIELGNIYCTNCGEKINVNNSVNILSNKTDFNMTECINELMNIIQPLQKVEEINCKKELYKSQAKKAGNDMELVLNIAAGIISFFGSMIISFALAFIINIKTFEQLFYVFVMLICLIYAAIKFFFKPMVQKNKAKEADKYENMAWEAQQSAQNAFQEVYPVLSKYIPEDYWYSDAVSSIASYFRNSRADNMKEAINLYEEEMSRLRIENMQAAILRENKKQSVLAAFTAINTARTAFNTSKF